MVVLGWNHEQLEHPFPLVIKLAQFGVIYLMSKPRNSTIMCFPLVRSAMFICQTLRFSVRHRHELHIIATLKTPRTVKSATRLANVIHPIPQSSIALCFIVAANRTAAISSLLREMGHCTSPCRCLAFLYRCRFRKSATRCAFFSSFIAKRSAACAALAQNTASFLFRDISVLIVWFTDQEEPTFR